MTPAPTTPALTLSHVKRLYNGKAAVGGVSLTLESGKITCLLGPSGCGKSTLLRLIAGLEPLDAGTVATDRILSGHGTYLPPEQRNIGFVFQDYALFPHLSVADNVGFGLRALAAPDRARRIRTQLDRVQLGHRADAFPQTLSGGEQQRIALARALARQPALVLLDEPFSGLDSYLKSAVRDATLNALHAAGTTALIVTHDAEEALMMADHLALMQDGQILQVGTPKDCYQNPVSAAAARLLGPVNVLDVVVTERGADSLFGTLPANKIAHGAALLLLRPEAISFGHSGLAARVSRTQFAGANTVVTLEIHQSHGQDIVLQGQISSNLAPNIGETVAVEVDLTQARLVAA